MRYGESHSRVGVSGNATPKSHRKGEEGEDVEASKAHDSTVLKFYECSQVKINVCDGAKERGSVPLYHGDRYTEHSLILIVL